MSTSAYGFAPGTDGLAATQRAWEALRNDKERLNLPNLTIQPLCDLLKMAEGGQPDDPTAAPGLLPNPHLLPSVERGVAMDQAQILLENLYPHLPFKQRDFPYVDPVGMLAKLRGDEPKLDELDFHVRMLEVFANVRDPHTTYVLPEWYQGAVAFLPFRAGLYEDEAGKIRYIVTSVMEGFDVGDFQPGVELVSCEGEISQQIAKAAALTPGANQKAQLRRGVARLTVRPIASSGVALWDNRAVDTTTVEYLPEGSTTPRSISMRWGVARGLGTEDNFPPPAFHSKNIDQCETQRAGDAMWRQSTAATAPDEKADLNKTSTFPDAFEFQTRNADTGQSRVAKDNLVSGLKPDGKFGYIRIKEFAAGAEVTDLSDEFRRILTLLQPEAPDGLILDVRGNPGGVIESAEQMLTMLTPKAIEPANFQMANTAVAQQILKAVKSAAGQNGVPESLQRFTNNLPDKPLPDGPELTGPEKVTTPNVGNTIATNQAYQGPVVLVTDALTYSAAEIFTGGFSDHVIGKIISPDQSTGGGGASVWRQQDIVTVNQSLASLPGAELPAAAAGLQQLPAGAGMTLAIVRSSRVRANLGNPIEDVGVPADIVRPPTKNDLLAWNGVAVPSDVVRYACDVLAAMPVHRIELGTVQLMADRVQMAITPVNVERMVFTFDQNPTPVEPMTPATAGAPVVLPGSPFSQIQVTGFVGEEPVAFLRWVIPAQDSDDQ